MAFDPRLEMQSEGRFVFLQSLRYAREVNMSTSVHLIQAFIGQGHSVFFHGAGQYLATFLTLCPAHFKDVGEVSFKIKCDRKINRLGSVSEQSKRLHAMIFIHEDVAVNVDRTSRTPPAAESRCIFIS